MPRFVVPPPVLRRLLPLTCLATALLTACESRQTTDAPTATPAAPDSVAVAKPTPAAPDTTDFSATAYDLADGRDTTFLIDGQPYRLLLRADADSTKPLLVKTDGIVGEAFANDTSTFARDDEVRGYEGGHTITLLDPKGWQLFRRRLRKQDFFGVASPDIVAVSAPERPRFLGYHAPSQTLLFRLDIAIPASDVWQECVIVLGLDGRLRHLATVFESNWNAADCVPRLLPDGTVLSCQELLRPDGRRIRLTKPKSSLMAAFPLNDSLLLTMYQYGEYKQRLIEPEARQSPETAPLDAPVSAGFNEPEWVPDPRMRNAPNAFVINTRGQVRQRLRFANFAGAIMTEIPRYYLWPAHRYYLLDDDGSLLIFDKQNPSPAVRVRRTQLQRFRPPRRPAEVRFELSTPEDNIAFYVDPARPTQLRYERIEPRQ